jgi:hypothetical protein
MRTGGLIFAAGCAAATLLAACGSGDSNDEALISTPDNSAVCSRPVQALTNQPVTRERLDAAIGKMREVQTAAENDGAQAANAAFGGDTHAITHDIDPPLRAADPQLAQDLCAAIVVVEQQLGATPDLRIVGQQASIAADLLQQSGEVLGVYD